MVCLFVCLLIAGPVWSAPFLTCDPYAADTQVDFKVRFDGGVWLDVAATVNTDGTRYLRMDVAPVNLASGTHTVEVRAVNMWAESPTTPFSFSKSVPEAPASTRLSKQ